MVTSNLCKVALKLSSLQIVPATLGHVRQDKCTAAGSMECVLSIHLLASNFQPEERGCTHRAAGIQGR